jgi:hypothetical protein
MGPIAEKIHDFGLSVLWERFRYWWKPQRIFIFNRVVHENTAEYGFPGLISKWDWWHILSVYVFLIFARPFLTVPIPP